MLKTVREGGETSSPVDRFHGASFSVELIEPERARSRQKPGNMKIVLSDKYKLPRGTVVGRGGRNVKGKPWVVVNWVSKGLTSRELGGPDPPSEGEEGNWDVDG